MNKGLKPLIIQLDLEGLSKAEICKKLNCSTGVVYFHLEEKNRERQRKRLQKRRKNIKDALKLRFGGKCSICGYNRCLAALDFHHKDGKQKLHNIASLIKTTSMKMIEAEISKCIMVCSNCHRELHHGAHGED